MKRKVSDIPSRIWTYGCRAPTVGADLVETQLVNAHHYYNKLIEIERARRNAYRKARRLVGGEELERLEQAHEDLRLKIETARTELKALRQKARQRTEYPAAQQAVKELIVQRKVCKAARDTLRASISANEALKAESDRINKESNAAVRAARAKCGVFWGTYLLVEKAIESARHSKIDPDFRRRALQREGRIGVQIHHEKLSDILAGKGTFLQFDPLPSEMSVAVKDSTDRQAVSLDQAWKHRSGRRQMRTRVRIRVGSTESRAPIWAEFPVILHRKPPEDATVTWAWIKIRRVGTQTRYELQLTLESRALGNRLLPTSRGIVGLDLCWRLRDNGIRLAYLVDDQGKERELIMPHQIQARLMHCAELRGHSDRHFEAVRKVLVGALPRMTVPDWVTAETETLPQWRSHGRLAALVERWVPEVFSKEQIADLWQSWKTERLENRLDLFDTYDQICGWCAEHGIPDDGCSPLLVYLEWWRRKNRHLYQWECNQRESSLLWRRDLYRNWAADLRTRYETIVIEDFDLRRFCRKEMPEEERSNFQRAIRFIAAPSELRLAIISAAGRDRVIEKPCEETTQRCHLCGHVNKEWAVPDELVQQCAGCARTWDQDFNACHNLLDRYFKGTPKAEAAE